MEKIVPEKCVLGGHAVGTMGRHLKLVRTLDWPFPRVVVISRGGVGGRKHEVSYRLSSKCS